MKLEVICGFEKKIQPRFQARGVQNSQGRKVALKQVARDVALNENLMGCLIRELNKNPQDAFPKFGDIKAE